MNELWIRFADAELRAFDWWRFEGDDARPADAGQGQDEELGRLERALVCRIFLPQSALLVLEAQLPPRASRQQLQAIGYALEDRLANDVEDNHFALGAQDADGRVPVVVVERALMDRLLDRLKTARLECDFVHGEHLLCPDPEADSGSAPDGGPVASLCARPGGWLLRWSRDQAVALSPELLRDGLRVLAGGKAEPLVLLCCQQPDGIDDSGVTCIATDCPLLRERIGASAINLLQGAYRPGSRWRERLRPWRPVLLLLLLLLGVSLFSSVFDFLKQRQQLDRIEQAQWALIDQYLPGTEHRGDPKRLLIRRLGALQEKGDSAGIIDLLSRFSALKKGFDALKVDRLLYRKGELIVDLEAPKLKHLEQLEQKLKQQADLSYRIENLDIGPQKTRARVILGGRS